MNGTIKAMSATISSLPARGSAGRRFGSLDDLLRRPEPIEHVAHRRFAGGLLLAQRRLDVTTDLGDELGSAGPLHVRCGMFEPPQVVVDQAVSFHGVHRLSFH